ncbi:MAG TPA: cytochrome c [Candidatus Polarisedimenticolaceae bacterium]|nr:cytochrome c [Candidatus Polarisedimenticolaceae bacterium]
MSARSLVIAFVALGLVACARKSAPPKPADAAAAVPPSYEMRLGRDTYVHYCATCHGDAGAGDGFNAYNLDPHPRDLSDAAVQKKTDAQIADAISRGGSGVGLSSLMPPWAHTLSDRQVAEVVLYVRSLKKSR